MNSFMISETNKRYNSKLLPVLSFKEHGIIPRISPERIHVAHPNYFWINFSVILTVNNVPFNLNFFFCFW